MEEMPRKKSFERGEALSQIMMVFWRKGYQATSISDLEAATGLNKRSLYNEFGEKRDIFELVLTHYLEAMGGMLDTLAQAPLGLHNIKSFFGKIVYEPDSLGCLLTKTINQKDLVAPSAFSTIKAAVMETEQWFYKNLYAELRNKRKATRLAAFLTSNLQGITTMANLAPEPARLRHVVTTILTALDAEVGS